MGKDKWRVNYRDLSYLKEDQKKTGTCIIAVVILAQPESPYLRLEAVVHL